MKYTFRGGAIVDEHKITASFHTEIMPSPDIISIPLSQHIGTPAEPIVSVGDTVFRGQVIAESTKGIGCPIHSSVSGKVKAIDSRNNANGVPVRNIVIESDGFDTLSPEIHPFHKPLSDTTPDEIVDIIKHSGISGMGGAMFPTHVKVSSAIGKADRMIINCAECEPYITADHRMMLEHPEAVIGGIEILLKALGIDYGDIAIEDNKLDAVEALKKASEGLSHIRIYVCKTKYPQGDERQLMYALTGRELPPGKLPSDIGCVLFNCSTCAAIYNAFTYGMPLIERIVTVSGDCIASPKNVLTRIGTSYRDLIDFCGGLTQSPEKLISGGPMMGAAQWDINSSVTKGTSALLALSHHAGSHYDQPPVCIRCGRCVKNCPMHLMPNYLVQYAIAGKYDDCSRLGVMGCVECGTCSYNCPGHMMIVQYIRVAKGAIRANTIKK